MKRIFFAFIALWIISCSAQKNDIYNEDKNLSVFLNKISQQQLQSNLNVIASDAMQGRMTGSEGQKKAAQYIVSYFEKEGITFPPKATGWYQTVPKTFINNRFDDSDNIWAFVQGSEKPEEIIVISAHYDHIGMNYGKIYNGADDNGSGTVAVMELARIFNEAKKQGQAPKRSLLFLLLTAEEIGLYGSDYYTQNPLYPLQNTVANINIDMIGRIDNLHTDNKYIYVIGADRLSSELHNINEAVNKKYTQLNLDYKYDDRNDPWQIYYRSDHYNFAKYGIPSVFFFNGIHDDYHEHTDTIDKIDFEAMTNRTKLIFALAWELANRPERIKVDRDGK
ncbi:MAG: M28 family metallopeptidase [Capnocytophaga sp.]|nr:M28 family metallopeptidase [Capnocytophaga sp.]